MSSCFISSLKRLCLTLAGQSMVILSFADFHRRMTAQSDRGYCYHTLFLFSLLVFAAFSVAYHKKQFLGRYPPPLPTANRLCRLRYENINGDGDAKASTPFFCAMPKHLQFDKFIWLLSDGLPRGMVDDTFHHYGVS